MAVQQLIPVEITGTPTPPPFSAADKAAHAAASHVRVIHDAPPAPALVALLDSTRGVVARWEAEQIAADIAAYVAAGGAEGTPGNVVQLRSRRHLTGVAA